MEMGCLVLVWEVKGVCKPGKLLKERGGGLGPGVAHRVDERVSNCLLVGGWRRKRSYLGLREPPRRLGPERLAIRCERYESAHCGDGDAPARAARDSSGKAVTYRVTGTRVIKGEAGNSATTAGTYASNRNAPTGTGREDGSEAVAHCVTDAGII